MDSSSKRPPNSLKNNAFTTVSHRFDNLFVWCHCSHCRGGSEVTMSNLTFAARSSGCGATSGYLRSLIPPKNFATSRVLTPDQRSFSDSRTLSRSASMSYCPVNGMVDGVSALSHPTLLIDSASQFCRKTQRGSPQLVRISGGLPFGSSPAANGDPLMSVPCLAARSVENGLRTRRPYQLTIEII